MQDATDDARDNPARERDAQGDAHGNDRLDRHARGLSPWAQRVAWRAAEAMLCDEDERGELVPASAEVCERAVASLDRSLGLSSPELRRGFALLAALLEILPLFVTGALGRMSRLPLRARLAYLEALESSRVGLLSMLLVAFKVPLCIPAFEEGAELAMTGFDRASTAARRGSPGLLAIARPAAPRALEGGAAQARGDGASDGAAQARGDGASDGGGAA